jgi:hypothetical protein
MKGNRAAAMADLGQNANGEKRQRWCKEEDVYTPDLLLANMGILSAFFENLAFGSE